jgi:hypothetical protein
MKVSLPLFLILCISFNLIAQNTMVRVKAGENAATVLAKEIYIYPEFTKGRVWNRDGSLGGGLMNYNTLVHEMQFIDQKGDTLALAHPETVRAIIIEGDSFFYDRIYVKQVASGDAIRLLKRSRLRVADKQKIGAYDMPTSNSSIESYNSFTNGLMRFAINVREDILMNRETLYYFADRYDSFVPANRRSLLKLLGRRHSEGEKYLKDHSVDFNNESDLVNLVAEMNGH